MVKSALHSAIHDELTQLERVVLLLKEEQTALTRARVDCLITLTSAKEQAIAELEQLSQKRQAVMLHVGVPDDKDAVLPWIDQHEPTLREYWVKLIGLARQSVQYNQSNSQLIAFREEANRALMNILITQHEAETSYTANGYISSQATSSRRRLDCA